MRFSLLGPLTATYRETSLSLGPVKQQMVLACLLLNPNRPVPVGAVVDALWDAPPPSAVKNVQLYVGRVRRILGAAEQVRRLHTIGRGYQLDVGPGELDAERFRRLVCEAMQARRRHDNLRAGTLFTEALRLWQDRPLGMLADTAVLGQEVRALENLRLMACEEHFALMLEVGRHREVIPDLQRIVIAHPQQEQLRYQLMLALSRAGDRSAALSTYRSGYRLLVDEGIEPSRALRELHDSILADAASARPVPRGAAEPRPVRQGERRGMLSPAVP
ncbi:BTAD domain-containing putative transcriptional regulator [Streptomyces sp. NPDC058683]|uniref:AfsR/SARP family transcriptional regulator n=1 Tax=Streptomyces sp. NPDC058683 TaxID=3346597 RepID=UPI00365F6957